MGRRGPHPPQEATGSRHRTFFYWGTTSELVEEADGAGAAQVRYTNAPDGDALWQHQVPENRRVYLLDDLDGSMGTQLNEDGSVAEQKPYAPYGKPHAAGASRSVSANGQILGHQKAMADNATGFSFLGPRAYDWNINRFITPDTFVASELDVALGVDTLTGNRYLFAAANPVAFYEDGHAPCPKGWRGLNCRAKRLRHAVQDTIRHPAGTVKSGYRSMSPTGQGLVAGTMRAAPLAAAAAGACLVVCTSLTLAAGTRLAASRVLGEASVRFARSGGTWNTGFIWVGWNWSQPLRAKVFRVAIGGATKVVHWHLDIGAVR